MRLLILLNGRFPTEKAYGLQVLAMARGAVEAGVDVTIAFPRRSKGKPPEIPGVSYAPFGWYLPLLIPRLFPIYRFLGLFGLRRVVREVKPDVVLANDPFQAAFFPRPWNVVWDLHDVPNLDRPDRRWLVRRVLTRVTAILSTNHLKLSRLRERFGALPAAIVMPNPVTFDPQVYRCISRDDARRDRGMSDDECAVVYAGQLYDWKGVDTLVEAARFLSALVTIHIVGGMGKDLERCRSLAQTLPSTAAKVMFHGMRPAEEIPSWLRAADLVVIPNSGKFRRSLEETDPLKLHEAIAAEAEIVASDLPSIREVASGFPRITLVKPDDPEALAAAIRDRATRPATVSSEQRASVLTAKQRVEQLVRFFQENGFISE